jgi:hypothetical protein
MSATRRLATILAADVVGCARRMGGDGAIRNVRFRSILMKNSVLSRRRLV